LWVESQSSPKTVECSETRKITITNCLLLHISPMSIKLNCIRMTLFKQNKKEQKRTLHIKNETFWSKQITVVCLLALSTFMNDLTCLVCSSCSMKKLQFGNFSHFPFKFLFLSLSLSLSSWQAVTSHIYLVIPTIHVTVTHGLVYVPDERSSLFSTAIFTHGVN
jgi:hypothetical protein